MYHADPGGVRERVRPNKLAALADGTLPDVGYYSDTDTTPERLEALSRGGYVPNITMAWGKDYPGIISHMVTNAYYRANGWACIIDSNDPGRYHWIPATECGRASLPRGFSLDVGLGEIDAHSPVRPCSCSLRPARSDCSSSRSPSWLDVRSLT